jgi:hypothetical protein
LTARPGASNNHGLAHIHHLLDHILPAEQVMALRLRGKGIEGSLVLGSYVLNMAEPLIDQA